MKEVREVLLRHRAAIGWVLPFLWVLTLLLPTSGDQPWKYLSLCLLAFALGLRNGLLAFAARSYMLGLMWLLAGAGVLIINFAKLYHDAGLVESGSHRDVSLVEAIYFSIVTWTTLGYGDFSPSPDIRIYASLEALLGYVYMAVGVGVTVSVLGHPGQANSLMQTGGASRRR